MDKLTKEKIFKAADELKQSGERVTLNRVRERLGGGSFTTIGQALKEWKKIKAEEESGKISNIPEELQVIINNSNDYLRNIFFQFWTGAEKLLEIKHEEEIEKITIENNELKEQLKDYIESLEVLEEEHEYLKRTLHETEKLFGQVDNHARELEDKLMEIEKAQAQAEKQTQTKRGRTTRKKAEE